jgi:hypothetical protein
MGLGVHPIEELKWTPKIGPGAYTNRI